MCKIFFFFICLVDLCVYFHCFFATRIFYKADPDSGGRNETDPDQPHLFTLIYYQEVQKKEAGFIQQRKRRALNDLFKTLQE